jgi:molybdopterin converting factor small subunit
VKLKVTYTAQLKAALQVDQEEVELQDGAGIAELLELLAARYPDHFSRMALSGNGKLAPSILLCVNDEQLRPDAPTSFRHGDQIIFLSAISGG